MVRMCFFLQNDQMNLYPFVDYWPFYLVFTCFILAVLVLDLGVFHKKTHAISFKEATVWTSVWISLALIFNLVFYFYSYNRFSQEMGASYLQDTTPHQLALKLSLEFLTGFIVEKSLAIDNIFVFTLVFSFFGISKTYQHHVLFYGIIGAILFRAIFIAAGSYLMTYHWVIIFFGIFLVVTGAKMLLSPNKIMDPEKNILLRILQRVFRIYPRIESKAFFVRKEGRVHATPLLVGLIFLEISDIIFAVDSVPAIFALTNEPLIVFTSNIFAMMGLRSMYFMISGVMDRFIYIKYGLASVLIFVGLKMAWLNEAFGGKFPISWSLAIIGSLIGGSILFSLLATRKSQG